MVHRDDLERFMDNEVSADLQPSCGWIEDERGLYDIVRYDKTVPIGQIHSSGAIVTLSSKWDKHRKNPLFHIMNAVEREDQKQAIDVKTAVEMYTINGAYAMRQESYSGSITPGKLADLVILDTDIFRHGQEELSSASVLATLVGGNFVYKHTQFKHL